MNLNNTQNSSKQDSKLSKYGVRNNLKNDSEQIIARLKINKKKRFKTG